jgi:hypothetical protein
MAEVHNTKPVPPSPLRMSQRTHAEKMEFKQQRRQRWYDIISEAHAYFKEHDALTTVMKSRLQNMHYPTRSDIALHRAPRS